MSLKYIVYENNEMWIDSVKKRKVDEIVVSYIEFFYSQKKQKMPKIVYGYWDTKGREFIEDEVAVKERNP